MPDAAEGKQTKPACSAGHTSTLPDVERICSKRRPEKHFQDISVFPARDYSAPRGTDFSYEAARMNVRFWALSRRLARPGNIRKQSAGLRRSGCEFLVQSRRTGYRSDRNLPPDLDDLIVRQAEEVADVDGVALHDGEEPLLPCRQAPAVLAADHRLMTDVVGDIVEIDRAAQRSTGGEQFRDMRPLP